MGLRQGCVTSPWLFNIYMDGVMKEIKGETDEGVKGFGKKVRKGKKIRKTAD